jgi:hypothetical protein
MARVWHGSAALNGQGPAGLGGAWRSFAWMLPPPGWRRLRGSNPVPGCFAVRGWSGDGPVSCDSHVSTVTARAHRGPVVSDAVRTQRGPGACATASFGKLCWAAGQRPAVQLSGLNGWLRLSVGDAANRRVGHLEGTAGEGRRWLRPGGDGHQLA